MCERRCASGDVRTAMCEQHVRDNLHDVARRGSRRPSPSRLGPRKIYLYFCFAFPLGRRARRRHQHRCLLLLRPPLRLLLRPRHLPRRRRSASSESSPSPPQSKGWTTAKLRAEIKRAKDPSPPKDAGARKEAAAPIVVFKDRRLSVDLACAAAFSAEELASVATQLTQAFKEMGFKMTVVSL